MLQGSGREGDISMNLWQFNPTMGHCYEALAAKDAFLPSFSGMKKGIRHSGFTSFSYISTFMTDTLSILEKSVHSSGLNPARKGTKELFHF